MALWSLSIMRTLQRVLAALSAFRPLSKGRLIVVFGCGGDRDRIKRSEMGSVASLGADQVFLTGDNSRSEATEDIVAEILVGVADRERPNDIR